MRENSLVYMPGAISPQDADMQSWVAWRRSQDEYSVVGHSSPLDAETCPTAGAKPCRIDRALSCSNAVFPALVQNQNHFKQLAQQA